MNCSTDIKQRRVTFEIDKAIDEEAVLAAAHAFAGRAEVWTTDGGVELEAQEGSGLDAAGLESLAEEFNEELVAQELRRRIAASNRSVREYLITQALLAAANEQGQQTADPQLGNLTGDQEDEIARLIREAEQELSGGDLPGKGAAAVTGEGGEGQDEPLDPKEILKAWEEKSGA